MVWKPAGHPVHRDYKIGEMVLYLDKQGNKRKMTVKEVNGDLIIGDPVNLAPVIKPGQAIPFLSLEDCLEITVSRDSIIQ